MERKKNEMRGYYHIILDLCRELLKTVVCMKDGVKQLTLCRVFFFSVFYQRQIFSESFVIFYFFFIYNYVYAQFENFMRRLCQKKIPLF